MSNLGFQWVYRLFNRVADLVCERFFHEEGQPAVTFETGTPLSDFGLLAWSLSWEMDFVNFLRTLAAAGHPDAARGARRARPDAAGRRRLRADQPVRAHAVRRRLRAGRRREARAPRRRAAPVRPRPRRVPRGGGGAAGLLRSGGPRPARRGARRTRASSSSSRCPARRSDRVRGPAHDDPHAADGALRQAPDRDLARLHRDVPLLLGRVRDGAGQAVPGVVHPLRRAGGAAAHRPRRA